MIQDLAEAFPNWLRPAVQSAAEAYRRANGKYSSGGFTVWVSGETVHIPNRIHVIDLGFKDWNPLQQDMALCLLTRSTNGYVRQKALKEVLSINHAWSIPFVVALMGEYVVEILEDIHTALPQIDRRLLSEFLSANPGFWQLTQARIMSYWSCYYRRYPRDTYIGFRLIRDIEALRQ